jgi:DNA-binding Xre family transcriptional regulator
MYARYLEKHVVAWREDGPFRLLLITDEGRKYIYNDRWQTTRCIFDPEAEYAERGYFTEEEWRIHFARTLMYKMEDRRIGQVELSEHTGISQSSISAYLNKKKSPSAHIVQRLARVLHCSVDDLTDFDYLFD